MSPCIYAHVLSFSSYLLTSPAPKFPRNFGAGDVSRCWGPVRSIHLPDLHGLFFMRAHGERVHEDRRGFNHYKNHGAMEGWRKPLHIWPQLDLNINNILLSQEAQLTTQGNGGMAFTN